VSSSTKDSSVVLAKTSLTISKVQSSRLEKIGLLASRLKLFIKKDLYF